MGGVVITRRDMEKDSVRGKIALIASEKKETTTLDGMIESGLLSCPMSQIVTMAEREAPSAGAALVSQLIVDAGIVGDIRFIKQLIGRLDGGSPLDTELEHYRTEFGDTLNMLLQATSNAELEADPNDLAITFICKKIIQIALEPSWKLRDVESKNRKDAAVGIILDRCGGRKTTPAKDPKAISYEEPDWVTEQYTPEENCNLLDSDESDHSSD